MQGQKQAKRCNSTGVLADYWVAWSASGTDICSAWTVTYERLYVCFTPADQPGRAVTYEQRVDIKPGKKQGQRSRDVLASPLNLLTEPVASVPLSSQPLHTGQGADVGRATAGSPRPQAIVWRPGDHPRHQLHSARERHPLCARSQRCGQEPPAARARLPRPHPGAHCPCSLLLFLSCKART